MTEIRKCIIDREVTGGRFQIASYAYFDEMPASRVPSQTHTRSVDAEALDEWDDSNEIKSLLSGCGFVIEEVLQRSVMPGRGV